ncbi:MAG: VOC family protein [Eubacteriales bacterium]|nr:VOC family protein [Eubacteriales bacterium]
MKILQVLSRVFVEDLNKTIPVYELLLNETCKMRFEIPPAKVELAQVGSVLLYAGEGIASERRIDISFVADNLEEWRAYWLEHGGAIVRDLWPVAGGRNMILRHADGTVAEYLEFFEGGHPCRN